MFDVDFHGINMLTYSETGNDAYQVEKRVTEILSRCRLLE